MRPIRVTHVAMVSVCLTLVGCGSTSPDEDGTIYFELDAPLCSSQLPVEMRIDDSLVGVDTFRVNLAPEHLRSRGFPVRSGEHSVSAEIPGGYDWGDTLVQVRSGTSVTRLLPFYCS